MSRTRNYSGRKTTLIDLGNVTKSTRAQFVGSISDGGVIFPFIFKVPGN